MSLRRILQMLLSSFIGQGVSVITQLLIPPFFLRCYANGVSVYGEWIALSASITYLGTLNYGIQTYANNETTIRYNRGDVHGAKTVQASALTLLLILIAIFIAIGAVVLFLPVGAWLNLKYVSSQEAAKTVCLLIIQMAVTMLFSLAANSFMVIGKLPRGNNWINAQRLFSVVAMSGAIWLKASFPTLALVQLGSYVLFLALVVIDIRLVAPVLLPSLRYGTRDQVRAIIKPSGHFMLIAFAGFLTWQGPVLLIQKVLGPAAVAVFALARVVFQMSRQLLSIASYAVGQDITLLVGEQNWPQLRRLYELSERVVLFLIPVVSVGSLLLCPFLFTVWLHKRDLYQPSLCILMAVTSAVLGIKEHKTQFQSSSNKHERLSLISVAGYSVMLAVSVPVMKSFGLLGFMCTWVAWEILQTAFVVRLNVDLFPAEQKISMAPLARLAVFMTLALGIAAWPAYLEVNWQLSASVAVAALITALLGAAAYLFFDLGEVRTIVASKMQRKAVQVA
jgi:O-antigen/teichoic acid export membrane protein